jgi:hypothetical protein
MMQMAPVKVIELGHVRAGGLSLKKSYAFNKKKLRF